MPPGPALPNADPDWILRPATSDDHDALYQVYEASMGERVTRLYGWETHQHRAFHTRLMTELLSDLQTIESGGRVAGLLLLERPESEIHIARIEVHPDFQGRGIGAGVIERIKDEAKQAGLPVTLDVFMINTDARRFYERLGFQVTHDSDEKRHHMRWDPK